MEGGVTLAGVGLVLMSFVGATVWVIWRWVKIIAGLSQQMKVEKQARRIEKTSRSEPVTLESIDRWVAARRVNK